MKIKMAVVMGFLMWVGCGPSLGPYTGNESERSDARGAFESYLDHLYNARWQQAYKLCSSAQKEQFTFEQFRKENEASWEQNRKQRDEMQVISVSGIENGMVTLTLKAASYSSIAFYVVMVNEQDGWKVDRLIPPGRP